MNFAIYGYRVRYLKSRLPLLYGALHPISVGTFAYAMLKIQLDNLCERRHRVVGTKHPLELLKKNVV